jgi:hypothetical protein
LKPENILIDGKGYCVSTLWLFLFRRFHYYPLTFYSVIAFCRAGSRWSWIRQDCGW